MLFSRYDEHLRSDGECGGSSDYAKKTCVDTQNNLQVAKAGDTMTGALAICKNKVTGLAGPTAAQDVAIKEYVNTVVRGRLKAIIIAGQSNTS